ncbi:MAG: hypothetical protein OEW87_04825 [Flavobacteriaceae bacterium]|nr:hypothetical protein [Flavobacteriaceae bacterium]
MNRVIVDFKKLTEKILNLLVEKYPDGYNDSDIITFKNAQGETIEAVEVTTEDTKYLVKVSVKLEQRMEDFVDDDTDDDDAEIVEEKEIDFDDAGIDDELDEEIEEMDDVDEESE